MVTSNALGAWHRIPTAGGARSPKGYHFLPALSAVSAALSLVGVSSHWVTHVPGRGTVPWTSHLLPGPCPQPHTAPVLRCHLHPASASSSSTPAVTQRGQHPSPPCPTVCGSESPALPRGEATHHPGRSSLSWPAHPAPMGRGSFCAAPRGQRTAAGSGWEGRVTSWFLRGAGSWNW